MMGFEYSMGNKQVPVAYFTFNAMNTVMQIVIVFIAESKARKLALYIESMTRKLEMKLSRYIPESTILYLNTCLEQNPQIVDDEVLAMLALCEDMRQSTIGYFDIATFSSCTRRPAYLIDYASHTVELVSTDIQLDLGGIGKGYVLDRIRDYLSENGITNALMNFGNSSVLAIGTHPFGDAWSIGLDHSSDAVFKLCDQALSVSGKSLAGKAHIMNPKTGEAVSSEELLIVTGPSAGVCEVLSTALFAAPSAERQGIIERFKGYKVTTVCRDKKII